MTRSILSTSVLAPLWMVGGNIYICIYVCIGGWQQAIDKVELLMTTAYVGSRGQREAPTEGF